MIYKSVITVLWFFEVVFVSFYVISLKESVKILSIDIYRKNDQTEEFIDQFNAYLEDNVIRRLNNFTEYLGNGRYYIKFQLTDLPSSSNIGSFVFDNEPLLLQKDMLHFSIPDDSHDLLVLVISHFQKQLDQDIQIHYSNDGVGKLFYVSSHDNLKHKLINVCETNRLQMNDCNNIVAQFLQVCWDQLNRSIYQKFKHLFYEDAYSIANNEEILFLIEIPDKFSPGLGNVLKALTNSLSFHKHTKILNNFNYILGNYSEILHKDMIIDYSQLPKHFEVVNTVRFHVFVSEESSFKLPLDESLSISSSVHKFNQFNNIKISPIFSEYICIDQVYNRSLLPDTVVNRILSGIKRIKFLSDITEMSQFLSSLLTYPSLGVSVRTWAGPHESKLETIDLTRISREYIVRIQYVCKLYNISSAFIASDNIAIIELIEKELLIPVVHIGHLSLYGSKHSISQLEKAVIEMLTLSTTTHLLGAKNSTFLEMAYWLGGLQQRVIGFDEIKTLSASNDDILSDDRSICVEAWRMILPVSYENPSLGKIKILISNNLLSNNVEWTGIIHNLCYHLILTSDKTSLSRDWYGLCTRDIEQQFDLIRFGIFRSECIVFANGDLVITSASNTLLELNAINLPNSPYRLVEVSNELNVPVNSDVCDHIKEIYPNDVAALNHLTAIGIEHKSKRHVDKILCIVFTIESRHRAVEAVQKTWARKCDGFVVYSNVSDESLGISKIVHQGLDEYSNLYRKIVAIWMEVWKCCAGEFDWFLLANDDTFVIMEYLRMYIESESIRALDKGRFIGRRMKIDNSSNSYNTGGPGYLLDKVALKKLINAFTDVEDSCKTQIQAQCDDLEVANCLRESAGIIPLDSRDSSGFERFHHFSSGDSWNFNPNPIEKNWWASHFIEFKPGISSESISFHWMSPSRILADYYYFYYCR